MTTASTSHSYEETLQTVVRFFEQLQPSDVSRIADLYTADAQFKDPFNEVTGTAAIERIFNHMFESLDAPRFVITQQVVQPPSSPTSDVHCFVTWDFLFAMRRFDPQTTQIVRGATHLVLRESMGKWRVAIHRDYWDAAEELYEKLPLVGSLMRWLKRRVNA